MTSHSLLHCHVSSPPNMLPCACAECRPADRYVICHEGLYVTPPAESYRPVPPVTPPRPVIPTGRSRHTDRSHPSHPVIPTGPSRHTAPPRHTDRPLPSHRPVTPVTPPRPVIPTGRSRHTARRVIPTGHTDPPRHTDRSHPSHRPAPSHSPAPSLRPYKSPSNQTIVPPPPLLFCHFASTGAVAAKVVCSLSCLPMTVHCLRLCIHRCIAGAIDPTHGPCFPWFVVITSRVAPV